MSAEIHHDPVDLAALGAAWRGLEREAATGPFLSHAWVSAWWRVYGGIDQLWVMAWQGGGELRAVWPLALAAPRTGTLRAAELHLLGDLGGAQRSLVCRREDLAGAAAAITGRLAQERGWDALDVPLFGQKIAEVFERAAAASGLRAERTEVAGRPYLELPGEAEWGEFARARRPTRTLIGARYQPAADLDEGLGELFRVLRKSWAAREALGPAHDPQSGAFLREVLPGLLERGEARLGLLRWETRVIGADLVVRDGDRDVQLMQAVDPEVAEAGCAAELALASAEQATQEGARRLELAVDLDEEPPLKAAPSRVLRLRLWNNTTAGRLYRRVSSIREAISSAEAKKAIERLRGAAPGAVQRAVARVASYTVLHLYRGELFTRGWREAPDLELRLYPRDEFEALAEEARESFVARLDLQAAYCRQKWERGDTVVLAEVSGRPAGILWCARAAVFVPDIGRPVRPGPGECYIHDVYVHPDERGRQVAPAMLEFLARELRARDVYRAWALIERSNTASTRAFEKAAYASVADVVYARMGLLARLVVRPPDPEAKGLLGL